MLHVLYVSKESEGPVAIGKFNVERELTLNPDTSYYSSGQNECIGRAFSKRRKDCLGYCFRCSAWVYTKKLIHDFNLDIILFAY